MPKKKNAKSFAEPEEVRENATLAGELEASATTEDSVDDAQAKIANATQTDPTDDCSNCPDSSCCTSARQRDCHEKRDIPTEDADPTYDEPVYEEPIRDDDIYYFEGDDDYCFEDGPRLGTVILLASAACAAIGVAIFAVTRLFREKEE
ncbi:hypothetical protein IJ847_00015 [Candidatus Saccharibacteria bacterium]|nr:hypothetical protein [Candidatus Saccharibacteria bacterium]